MSNSKVASNPQVSNLCFEYQVRGIQLSRRRRLSEDNATNKSKPLTFRVIEHELKAEPVEIILRSGVTLRVACEERALRTVLAAIQ